MANEGLSVPLESIADDGTIEAVAVLFRLVDVDKGYLDLVTGEISPQVFRTQEMSFRFAALVSVESLHSDYPRDRVAEFTAGHARFCGFLVMRDKRDETHGFAFRADQPGKRPSKAAAKALRDLARLVPKPGCTP